MESKLYRFLLWWYRSLAVLAQPLPFIPHSWQKLLASLLVTAVIVIVPLDINFVRMMNADIRESERKSEEKMRKKGHLC